MIRLCRVALTIILATAVSPKTATAQSDNNGWRTIEIETTEVTAPDVAITPDGQTLIFTMLGHLFRLPVEGGTAEQLTFGPYYDSDVVFSSDGGRVGYSSPSTTGRTPTAIGTSLRSVRGSGMTPQARIIICSVIISFRFLLCGAQLDIGAWA